MSQSFLDPFKKQTGKCILVGLITQKIRAKTAKEHLEELDFLAETAGLITKKHFLQQLPHPENRTFVGAGKLEEIKNYILENEIDCAIFDGELSPSQMRNIEKNFKILVMDRPGLILDIFAQRAQSSYAKTQVELAQYEYLLPRLAGLWTHLERQKGGIGMRGPGETQIETDRRIVKQKISLLKEKLKTIDKQKASQRANREELIRVALVGYTNVGKSTLMNCFSKSDVLVENKLFATLDTTVRKIVWENTPFLLSDTVGFIRKLPHQLIESFKSTLEELKEADLLIHVSDISHPEFEHHFEIVQNTIAELKCENIPQIWVFNKIDQYQGNIADYEMEPDDNRFSSLTQLEENWAEKAKNTGTDLALISVTQKQNTEKLRELLLQKIKKLYAVKFPHRIENNT